MNVTVGVADTKIRIRLLGEAERARPLFDQYFDGYLCRAGKGDAELRIIVLAYPDKTLPLIKRGRLRMIEQRLSTHDVAAWLEGIHHPIPDFPITETTIASFFLNGLLLFNPDSSGGCILLKEGKGCHWPLYRLCWIYLAQVLGERKGCFVHSAALVRNGGGYLFIGPSGAGKTTLARRFGGSMILSDESPVLREQGGDCFLFPSPYRQHGSLNGTGKDLISLKAGLKGVYFLLKNQRTFLENISKREALPLIMNRQILFIRHLSARARTHLFHLFLDICDRIRPYNLHVSLDQDIWEAIEASDRRGT